MGQRSSKRPNTFRQQRAEVMLLDQTEGLGIKLHDPVVAVSVRHEHAAVPRLNGLSRLAKAVSIAAWVVRPLVRAATERRQDHSRVWVKLTYEMRTHVSHPQGPILGLRYHVRHHEHARAERLLHLPRAQVDQRDGVTTHKTVISHENAIKRPTHPVGIPPIEHPHALRVDVTVK